MRLARRTEDSLLSGFSLEGGILGTLASSVIAGDTILGRTYGFFAGQATRPGV